MTDTDTNLNNLESTILRILEGHQGRDNAVSRNDLVDRVNLHFPFRPYNERRIREVVKHLTTQHGIAIGSRSRGGYFMAATAQEIEKVAGYYDNYGLSSLFVSSRLRKIEMRDYLGQLSLKFDAENRRRGDAEQGGQS